MSTYKKISSKICIARMYDQFPIDSSEWEGRSPNWIQYAVSELGLFMNLESTSQDIVIDSYKAKLPTELKLIDGIKYENLVLPRVDKINNKYPDEIEDHYNELNTYSLDNNGYIYTTFETGTVTVYYKKLPVEYDEETKLYFPLVYDNEYVLSAIDYYLLYRLISRGEKIGTFSMESNNPFKNPGLMWERKRKIARNKIIVLDRDAREEFSRMTRTFLSDYEKYNKDIVGNK